jgi:hypothetical protein
VLSTNCPKEKKKKNKKKKEKKFQKKKSTRKKKKTPPIHPGPGSRKDQLASAILSKGLLNQISGSRKIYKDTGSVSRGGFLGCFLVFVFVFFPYFGSLRTLFLCAGELT